MLFSPLVVPLGGDEEGGNGAEIEGRASSADGCISGRFFDCPGAL